MKKTTTFVLLCLLALGAWWLLDLAGDGGSGGFELVEEGAAALGKDSPKGRTAEEDPEGVGATARSKAESAEADASRSSLDAAGPGGDPRAGREPALGTPRRCGDPSGAGQ